MGQEELAEEMGTAQETGPVEMGPAPGQVEQVSDLGQVWQEEVTEADTEQAAAEADTADQVRAEIARMLETAAVPVAESVLELV